MATLTQVIDQMTGHGLPQLPAGHPLLDGRIHRFGPKKKAWYSLRELDLRSGSRVVAGAFGQWRGTDNGAVPVKLDWEQIGPEERAALEAKQREFEVREQQKRAHAARMAALRARSQWEAASACDEIITQSASPYLQRKQVVQEKARLDEEGTLLVPMLVYGPEGARLVGLQKIDAEGGKRFNKGMEKVGAACLLGTVNADTKVIIIAEGYATAASLRMATNFSVPVIIAFDAGNLMPVAKGLRRDFPDAHLLFAADDDYQLEQRLASWLKDECGIDSAISIDGKDHQVTVPDNVTWTINASWQQDAQGIAYITLDARTDRRVRNAKFENAGMAKAYAAATAVGNASVVHPVFADRAGEKWTDFNDLHCQQGLSDVAEQVNAAIDATQRKTGPSLSLVKNPSPPVQNRQKAGSDAKQEGEGKKDKKDKPRKEYPKEHWDTVNYLRENFVLIYGTDEAYDEVRQLIIKVPHLRLAYTSDAVKFWLNSPDRRMVDRDCVVFDPTETCDPDTTVNLYKGFPTQPKAGQCDKIIALLKHLCDDNAEVMAWVLRWLAYPLQHKGAKMRTSIIVHGDEGSGKNLFFENVVAKIYGEYAGVIGNAQIEAQFNEWASRKLYMVCDEVVTRTELKQLKGKLKHLVTGERIMINPKGMAERAEANHMNFVFLSNELQPLALDKTDRRYLVMWTPPNKSPEFYKEVADQIANGGVEAFYHYLLTVPLDDFTEHTKPLMTEAKVKLIGLGLSPAEKFFREWSGGFLPLPFVCCNAQQLYLAFCRWCHLNGERFPPSQTLFGRTIDRIGFNEGVRRSVVKYPLGHEVKQRTVYLVGDEPSDKSRADWVAAGSSLFEGDLKKYRHVYDQSNVDS